MAHFPTTPIVPSERDAALAEIARQALARSATSEDALRLRVMGAGQDSAPFDLPPVVTQALLDALRETTAGHAFALVPIEADITTQQAADLLNVSRPYLISLVDGGVFPVRMVGNQRRLPLKEVLAYKADNHAKRRETLRQLAAYDQELGLE